MLKKFILVTDIFYEKLEAKYQNPGIAITDSRLLNAFKTVTLHQKKEFSPKENNFKH